MNHDVLVHELARRGVTLRIDDEGTLKLKGCADESTMGLVRKHKAMLTEGILKRQLGEENGPNGTVPGTVGTAVVRSEKETVPQVDPLILASNPLSGTVGTVLQTQQNSRDGVFFLGDVNERNDNTNAQIIRVMGGDVPPLETVPTVPASSNHLVQQQVSGGTLPKKNRTSTVPAYQETVPADASRWGPSIGDPTPGITIIKPDRTRMMIAVADPYTRDPEAWQEHLAIAFEGPADPDQPLPPLVASNGQVIAVPAALEQRQRELSAAALGLLGTLGVGYRVPSTFLRFYALSPSKRPRQTLSVLVL